MNDGDDLIACMCYKFAHVWELHADSFVNRQDSLSPGIRHRLF